jgi:hypothetical protein
MAFRLTKLDATNRAAFEALLTQAWEQTWGPELARALISWRYYERPSDGGTWLVFNDDRCVAMLDTFLRPYLLDGRRILVREGADWFCLPKYRPFGVGMKLMLKMMTLAEPMISIGGSEATRTLLPRLGWTRLPDVQRYVLPLKARGLASLLLRNRWPAREAYARVIPRFIPLRGLRQAPKPQEGVARVAAWRPDVRALDPEPLRNGLVQLLEQPDHAWIRRTPPDVAETLGLAFFLDDRPIGHSLSQIEPTISGLESRIVHLQMTQPTQAVADWMVAETASQLATRGAEVIRCWASSPEKSAALQRAGFVGAGPLPSYWWPRADAPAPSALDAGYLRADDAMPLAALRGRRLAASTAPSHPWSSPRSASTTDQVLQFSRR